MPRADWSSQAKASSKANSKASSKASSKAASLKALFLKSETRVARAEWPKALLTLLRVS
jgi:hypothetical protein